MGSLSLKTVLIAVYLIGAIQAVEIPPGESPVEFRISLSRDTLLVGDELVMTITATYPVGTRLYQPAEVNSDGQFLMKKIRLLSSRQISGTMEDRYEIVGSFFATGTQTIPDFGFVWHDSAGTIREVSAPAESVYVKSVLPADTAGLDIKDIIGPQALPGRKWLIFVIILAVLGALGVGYYLYRRRLASMPLPEIPPEPPYEVALRRLTGLKADKLIEKGDFKRYYIELTFILRNYIEGRFGIPAIESTTFELKRSLKHDDLPRPQAEAAVSVLMRADLVKFAKYIPDAQHANSDFDIVKAFVMATKPAVAEPEAVK